MDRRTVLCGLLVLLMWGMAPNAARGQSHVAAGPYAGYDFDYEAPLVGLCLRYHTPAPAFVFGANVEYVHQTDRTAEDPLARVLQLDLNGLTPLWRRGSFSVWGGGGPALQYIHMETRRNESENVVIAGGTDVRFGFNGVGETRLHLFGPLRANGRLILTLGTPLRTRLSGGVFVTL